MSVTFGCAVDWLNILLTQTEFLPTVCPNCSNALTISRSQATTEHPQGINRFECRTCPYQYVLDRAYYERTDMKRKEVADVLGGKDEWKNADSMAGECGS